MKKGTDKAIGRVGGDGKLLVTVIVPVQKIYNTKTQSMKEKKVERIKEKHNNELKWNASSSLADVSVETWTLSHGYLNKTNQILKKKKKKLKQKWLDKHNKNPNPKFRSFFFFSYFYFIYFFRVIYYVTYCNVFQRKKSKRHAPFDLEY